MLGHLPSMSEHVLTMFRYAFILFGHLELAKPSDSVRFGQMLGWLGLLIVSLSALVNFVRTQVVGKLETMRQWSSLSSIGGVFEQLDAANEQHTAKELDRLHEEE